MFCIHCGAKNDDTAKFCIKCGTRLEVLEAEHTDPGRKGQQPPTPYVSTTPPSVAGEPVSTGPPSGRLRTQPSVIEPRAAAPMATTRP